MRLEWKSTNDTNRKEHSLSCHGVKLNCWSRTPRTNYSSLNRRLTQWDAYFTQIKISLDLAWWLLMPVISALKLRATRVPDQPGLQKDTNSSNNQANNITFPWEMCKRKTAPGKHKEGHQVCLELLTKFIQGPPSNTTRREKPEPTQLQRWHGIGWRICMKVLILGEVTAWFWEIQAATSKT